MNPQELIVEALRLLPPAQRTRIAPHMNSLLSYIEAQDRVLVQLSMILNPPGPESMQKNSDSRLH